MRPLSPTRFLLTVAVALVFASPAGAAPRSGAARIMTWDGPAVSESRFVDPAALPESYFNEPPGVDPRPNALKADVYLPPGYSTHPGRRYPVLFLLHGHGDAYDSWPNPQNGDLMQTAAGFRGIIVMPDGDHGWYTNWWNGGARSAPAWERYHLDQLIPAVERRFRVRGGRRWHAIAGLSMGAEGAVFYASQRPGYFGSAASFSGPLALDRPEWPTGFNTQGENFETVFGPQAGFYTQGHNPKALIGNLRQTRLFVSVGDGVPNPSSPAEIRNTSGQAAELELRQHGTDFVNAAIGAGLDVTYTPHQGIHAWPYWRADLQNAIDWGFFERPADRVRRRHWTYDTVATVGDAWGVHYRFHDPPETVETLARTGRRLAGDGSGKVAIRTPGGCRLRERLPFETRLDSQC